MRNIASREIGERLREFRKRRGLTQEQLAELVDVTFQQIQKYENGSTRLNSDKIQIIAHALDIPISAIFDVESCNERLLSPQELELIKGFRALPSQEVREFVVSCLTKVSL